MQPTSELVALAREFHERGGTEGIENPYTLGRWIVHQFFEKDNVAFLIGYIDHGDDEAGDDYWAKSNKAIPIFTESELWAWLWNQEPRYHTEFCTCRKPEDPTIIRFVIDKADGKTWTQAYVIEHKNLHHVLYEAAVWVAERKRDDQ